MGGKQLTQRAQQTQQSSYLALVPPGSIDFLYLALIASGQHDGVGLDQTPVRCSLQSPSPVSPRDGPEEEEEWK